MRQIMAVLAENTPDVLLRVVGILRRRGLKVDSLVKSVCDDPALSRITFVFEGEPSVEQLQLQLEKPVEVHKAATVPADQSIARELALVKVQAHPAKRTQIMRLVDSHDAKVVDVESRHVVIEVTGTPEKVDALIGAVRDFGILETVRTGIVALERGVGAMQVEVEVEVETAALYRDAL